MAMRKSVRQELRKARELIRFMLNGKCCFFCHKPLISSPNYAKEGDGQASPISRTITIHHVNGNHSDNRRTNHRLSHTKCHKAYHMRQMWREGIFDNRRIA